MNYTCIFDTEHYKELPTHTHSHEAYFIHMKKSKDRLENINAQSKHIHVPIHISDAVDGSLLSIPDMVDQGLVSRDYYNMIKNPSVYGCHQSHSNLLRELYEKHKNGKLSTKYSLIMEDDVQVPDTFTKDIDTILSTLEQRNESFDIILLGHGGNHDGHLIQDNIYKYNPASFCIGLYSYIISHKSLEKMVPLLHPITEAIDWQIMNIVKSGHLRMLIISPVLTDPGTMVSTIGH
jgi:GR25 family glycosyltransferase involved in LPS biosynthesis